MTNESFNDMAKSIVGFLYYRGSKREERWCCAMNRLIKRMIKRCIASSVVNIRKRRSKKKKAR